MLTPHRVRYGLAADVLDNRQRVPLADPVWINHPKPGPPERGETH
jgi:hypothetical protein